MDTDDGDPYVCFRRREVRQVRKTRGRDAQSVEKLRKLRRELEEARQLVAMVKSREITRREQLVLERQLFEQRSSLRQVKRNLPDQYKEGDEDILINQKVGDNTGGSGRSMKLIEHSRKRRSRWRLRPRSVHRQHSFKCPEDRMVDLQRQTWYFFRTS